MTTRELSTLSYLIRYRFVSLVPSLSSHPVMSTSCRPERVTTDARQLPSAFEFRVSRTCTIAGRSRCILADVFSDLQEACQRLNIPFPIDRVFLAARRGRLRLPEEDTRFFTLSLPALSWV
ncbi:hypothetical protein L915_17982 [Phytophthora nicotianae]|uniref:Uncharacterized protein n=1 Tax=Phytophthora nicotianae TaxID=4792 RepID=W2I3R6_PHYNI|nr:hypothetical protein L915_17982 [Phytophthora nicotianae]ETL28821.1 hypothetical protein L916_17882 [Phytophthora nicotianae]